MLEKVQKRATKLIHELKKIWHYIERFKSCKIPTLHYKQKRGDIIEMYKTLSGKYDAAVIPRVNRKLSNVTRSEKDRSLLRLAQILFF